jgi:hypothetical protein
MQLHAFIEDHEVLILIDSASSASFLNKQLAYQMAGAQKLSNACKVNVSDGTQYRCSTYMPQCCWSSAGHNFSTYLKILPLRSFGAILGMDWLEKHNPDID